MNGRKFILSLSVVVFAVTFFVGMVWVSSYLVSQQSERSRNITNSSGTNPFVFKNGYSIIQGGSSDGRDVVYRSEDRNGFIFTESGVKTMYLNHKEVPTYIVGVFDRLETIPDYEHRLLYLKNPITGEELPKIVIQSDKESTTEALPIGTALGVEILNSEDDPKHIRMISSVSDFGWGKLMGTLRKGDVISVILVKDAESNIVLDERTGNYIGAKLILRRYVYKDNL